MVFSSAVGAGIATGNAAFGPLLQATDPLRRIQVKSLEQAIETQKQEMEFFKKFTNLIGEETARSQFARTPSPFLPALDRARLDVEDGLASRDPSRQPGFVGPPTPFNQLTDENVSASELAAAQGDPTFDATLPPEIAAARSQVLKRQAAETLQRGQLDYIQDNAVDLLIERLGADSVRDLSSGGKEQLAFQLLQTDRTFRDLVRSRASTGRRVQGLQTLGISDVIRGIPEFFTGRPSPSFEDLFGSLPGEQPVQNAAGGADPFADFVPSSFPLAPPSQAVQNARGGLLPSGVPIP